MRLAFAVSVATVICATAPAYADAQSHVQAAKRAERKGQWRKALAEWKAAYGSDVNAEYLVGIGDAYAHLGNKAQARTNYEAYLADPLALPATTEKVRAKVANLDGGAGATLALPGPAWTCPAGARRRRWDCPTRRLQTGAEARRRSWLMPHRWGCPEWICRVPPLKTSSCPIQMH